ncbi:MAG: preprotein translocase subunit YajC [Kiritimatiellia bacterium]|jgi:preprotein translocase subunit YajC|nr:preprotein translocase subunit YajC [Kiritimatiellia bacterium]
MNHELLSLFLTGSPLAQAAPGGGLGSMMPMMLIIFGIMYFMLIRPQQRREKERRAMVDAVKSGDRVIFSGGILGTVTNVKDSTLMVKIADNVKIEVARGSVSKVLEKGEKVGEEDAA